MLSLTREAVGKGEDEEVTDQVEVEGEGKSGGKGESKGEVSFFIFLFRRLMISIGICVGNGVVSGYCDARPVKCASGNANYYHRLLYR